MGPTKFTPDPSRTSCHAHPSTRPHARASRRRRADLRSVSPASEDEHWQIAQLLASKSDGEIFGETEFQVRDLVHKIGARAMQAALDGRKKGGTKGPA